MRTIILYSLCVASVAAMDRSQQVISPRCYDQISGVQYDVPRLYYFLQGAFLSAAQKKPEVKPSEMCSYFGAQNSDFGANLNHKTVSQYVNLLLLPRFKQMDDALDEKAQECGSREQAWRWFAETYFQQNVLVPAAKGYNRSLVTTDICLKPRSKTYLHFHIPAAYFMP